QQEFQDCIDRGGFLEYAEVHGNLYGTSRDQTDRITAEGRDVILEIDVQGAIAVLEKVPDAVSIFILPPSFEVLKARLTARNTEDAAGLALRLRNSITEVMQYERFDYVIVNEEVPVAARLLSSIILAERQKRNRQSEAIGCILDSFAAANEKTTG
ncbi:MAG TPA: guanylate kinase, partial [Blastocatellia bacterium]|nr:guanylate kinase [Blastocatellia bacterium]